MFDISFSELMLIGVIALIVIGPERLPKVARTVGHLLGRAQRYVNDVKTDIRKEMDEAEVGGLKDLKDQMQEAAHSVKASVEETKNSWRAPVDEAQEALKQASDSIKTLADSAAAPEPPPDQPASDAPAVAAPPPSQANAQPEDASDTEVVDTRTLPLPGFGNEHAPAEGTSDSTQAAKGSQP